MNSTPIRRWAVMAALAVLASGDAALAQIETNSNAPIDITANEAEVVNSKCLAIWKGAAEALQGDSRLRANTITVYQAPKSKDAAGQQDCGATERVIADGNVYYVTPTQRAHGARAVYTAASDEIVMTGNVVVSQGKDVARGDKLIIKVSTKQFTMMSTATGAGSPNRVRGVFYPKKADQPASGSAAAPEAQ
ncbi:MAG TPA: LptA/OstA family protein [Caulobacteraceae bacterium]|jgi:lipopolysaccharide export system protein LptA|nr:LptA/OstA family protein [Caulobacteraceae bacterium]